MDIVLLMKYYKHDYVIVEYQIHLYLVKIAYLKNGSGNVRHHDDWVLILLLVMLM